jgi:hypothetical protein
MLKIKKVTGNSLSPFFLPGDYVLLNSCSRAHSSLKPGDVIAFNHPDIGQTIKFVKENDPQRAVLRVAGSDKNSISSHKLGPVPYSSVIGKVILPIRKT